MTGARQFDVNRGGDLAPGRTWQESGVGTTARRQAGDYLPSGLQAKSSDCSLWAGAQTRKPSP